MGYKKMGYMDERRREFEERGNNQDEKRGRISSKIKVLESRRDHEGNH